MKGEPERMSELVARLTRAGCLDGKTRPHLLHAQLVLQDGSAAPEVLRLWAAFDQNYPWYLASRRSDQPIADEAGKVLAQPMARVLHEVCIDDVAEELNLHDQNDSDAQETKKYLLGLVKRFTKRFPGQGVILEPREDPQRILWCGPKGPVVIWYEDDDFERKERWVRYLEELFEED